MSGRIFLTGAWRHLAMINWRVDPALLLPLVPRGTVLDAWNGATYVSLVGFMFRDTRLLGIPVPGHRDFEEVNLRFYVRRQEGDESRRAVVFIRELVPRRAIAWTARVAYNEPYLAVPMRHAIAVPGRVSYGWRLPTGWCELAVDASGPALPIADGSEAEFITEHYWGYTRQRDGGTVEYRVTHPRWRTWAVTDARVTGDVAPLYGADFARVLAGAPSSAFLADGSEIAVHWPRRLAD